MKNVANRIVLLITIAAFAACSEESSKTLQVSGTIQNAQNLDSLFPGIANNGTITILLYEVPFGNNLPPVQVDSITIPATQKKYTLSATTSNEGMYDIYIPNGPMVPLVNDASNITVDLDFTDDRKFYNVSGSDASRQLQNFIFAYDAKSKTIDAHMNRLDSMKQFGSSDDELIAATDQKNSAINDLNKYLTDLLGNVKHPVVAAFILGRSEQTLPQSDFETTLANLVKKFPQDPGLADLNRRYETYKEQLAERERREKESSWVGKKAPELIMPDVNGKQVSLSSFRGKYVLVDFWASWCGPCRAENPNVVEAYHKYKDKNFTILGVSLDRSKDSWVNAIKQDQLNWTNISDLAYWNSKAVDIFNFDGIPFNVLIDPQGNVIGEKLRGSALTSKLEEVLQ